ncbi:MAG: hypothetical protein BMS9Abin28_0093 [Anaerolineae bacterium]|nr:MAG: hypothetical protein BMS9Abin28_0093 [Anaerolineae bacterium]
MSFTIEAPRGPAERRIRFMSMEELDVILKKQIRNRPMLNIAWFLSATAAALLLLIIGSVGGSAQSDTAPVDHLEVALWPEYDRPAMLVIYRFELAEDTALPATVALPVPAAAGQPTAIAWLGSDGTLYDAAFTSESAGEWLIVQIEMPEARTGQIEFYSDMDFADTRRSFLFEWPDGFELGGMSYEVQEPVSATDLRVNPAPDREGPGAFGLNYLTGDLGPQPAEGVTAISVTYEKSTPALSVEALRPLGEISTPADLQSGNLDLLPWLLAAAGIVALGGGVYYLAFRQRLAPQRAPRRRRKRGTDVELEASTVYCHQCGAAAGISDVYCRQCGTQLRRK